MHAVRTPHKMLDKKKNTTNLIEESVSEASDLNDSAGSKPMNETLMDLPLDESDQNLSLEGGNDILI